MNRILFDREEISPNGRVTVSRNDYRGRHMRKILKLAQGDQFRTGVVNGPEGTGLVIAADPEGYELQVTLAATPALPLYPITLLLAHPRPIVLKRMLRDLTSAGLGKLIVFPGELGEGSYLESSLWHGDATRRLRIEGAMQGGSTMIPELLRLPRLEDAVAAGVSAVGTAAAGQPATVPTGSPSPVTSRLLFADEEATQLLGPGFLFRGEVGESGAALGANGVGSDLTAVVIAVGGERGWTARERALFVEAGFEPFSLGARTLRTETAALFAVCTAAAEYGTLYGIGEQPA